ncbi:DMP19 family protein [Chryseolinea soli]|uniref:DUF4375 domain-containing protein n=1 Tax=Chryseolinea soli TaxID=2321403 RepID=A0A385SLU8_9BACT|nr:DUF4375 domain-containing protein [Chryseolinea soli]AYB31257.1 DUF4375 domain-containing protein [Chryseolinea soli]
MDDRIFIGKKYAEAVKGIKAEWLKTTDSRWYDYVVGLPSDLQVTYLVVVVHNQVFNGGFHQYFFNGYGQFAKETIRSLIKINAPRRAELLVKALKLVNKEGWPDNVFRERLLKKDLRQLFVDDDLFEPLNQLDIQYYDYDDKEEEDIVQRLSNYLQNP